MIEGKIDTVVQRTIQKEVAFEGIGIHTGAKSKIVVRPADANTGVVFIKDGIEIPAKVEYTINSRNSTCLCKDGQIIKTIEHLMATFHGLGIDNVEVVVEGEEIPILDGSARVFVNKILKVGLQDLEEMKKFALIQSCMEIKENQDRFLVAKPNSKLEIEYFIHYNNIPALQGKMTYTHNFSNFLTIYSAKTFVLKEDLKIFKKLGIGKGIQIGSNAILVNPNDKPEKFIKHKVLDLLGDLYLLGYPFLGKLYVHKGGHSLHLQFVKCLKEQRKVKIVDAQEVTAL